MAPMDVYEEIVSLRRARRRGAVATIVNVRGSIPSFKTAKMLVRDDGSIVGTIGGGCVEAEVWQAAREVTHSRVTAVYVPTSRARRTRAGGAGGSSLSTPPTSVAYCSHPRCCR